MIFLPPFLRSKQLQNASERATTTWADLGAEKEVSHNFSSDHDLYHTGIDVRAGSDYYAGRVTNPTGNFMGLP